MPVTPGDGGGGSGGAAMCDPSLLLPASSLAHSRCSVKACCTEQQKTCREMPRSTSREVSLRALRYVL